MRTITKFVTEDGREFTTKADAEAHENAGELAFKKYTTVSFSGRELLKKHTLSEYGIWTVRGEDNNPDMGGQHYSPVLGTFEGTLEAVINKAVRIPKFWTWGAGGDITKIVVTKV